MESSPDNATKLLNKRDPFYMFALWLVLFGAFIYLLISAPSYLKSLVSRDPQGYFLTGYQYYSEKKYDLALENLKTAATLDPKDIRNLKYLGLTYQGLQDRINAIKVFNDLLKLQPRNVEIWDTLAWNYFMNNDFPNALAGWNKVIELTPSSAEGYAGIARVHGAQQQWKEAIQFYEKALSMDSTKWELHHALGRIYETTGNKEKAAQSFTKVVEINPKHDDSYYRIGLYEIYRKNWDKAIDSISKANSLDPKNPYYVKDLAMAYENRKQKDDLAKAKILLENLLKLNPNDLDAQNRLKAIK